MNASTDIDKLAIIYRTPRANGRWSEARYINLNTTDYSMADSIADTLAKTHGWDSYVRPVAYVGQGFVTLDGGRKLTINGERPTRGSNAEIIDRVIAAYHESVRDFEAAEISLSACYEPARSLETAKAAESTDTPSDDANTEPSELSKSDPFWEAWFRVRMLGEFDDKTLLNAISAANRVAATLKFDKTNGTTYRERWARVALAAMPIDVRARFGIEPTNAVVINDEPRTGVAGRSHGAARIRRHHVAYGTRNGRRNRRW